MSILGQARRAQATISVPSTSVKLATSVQLTPYSLCKYTEKIKITSKSGGMCYGLTPTTCLGSCYHVPFQHASIYSSTAIQFMRILTLITVRHPHAVGFRAIWANRQWRGTNSKHRVGMLKALKGPSVTVFKQFTYIISMILNQTVGCAIVLLQ